jgi:diguanylate cyclase (GGDEF)-like protein/PAS domain S-box-containing protein
MDAARPMRRPGDEVVSAGDEALHSALASIPGVSVIVFACDQHIVALHGNALKRHGYVHEEMLGRPAGDVMRPQVWERIGPHVAEALAGETTTIRQRSEDRTAVYESTFAPVEREQRVVAATMTSRDITAQMDAEDELADAKGRLQAVLDHSPMAIYMRDLDQRWIVANAETCGIVGKSAEELVGRPMAEAFPREVYERLAANDREVIESGAAQSFDEIVVDGRSGEPRHTWSLKFPVRDSRGCVIGLGGVSLDVTERERTARELAAARGLFESVFASAPVGMLVGRVDDDRRAEVVQCNHAFASMLGRAPEELLGPVGLEIVHPDDLPLRRRLLEDLIAGRPAAAVEMRFLHRDGHEICALTAPSLTLGPDGERLVVVQAVDISERKTFEAQLQHLADRDPLTGLLNRRRFEEELARAVSHAHRHRRPAALLLLDLDGFKAVNDSFGHSAGDALLVRISDALHEVLRESDILARIGGDEFGLILPDTDGEASDVVADKLIRAVREHGSFLLDGRRAVVTVSIGITELNGRRGIDAAHLLREADAAMYQAKAAGRDAFVVHAPNSAPAAA